MAALIWFILLVGVACILGILIWDYQRKAARRDAASQERFDRIFKAKAPLADVTGSAGMPVEAAPLPKVAAFSSRERFLAPPQNLVYLLLRTGLPDHAVFANVTLASVITVPEGGADREQRLRRLSACVLDFVVCDREMRVIAVVDLDRQGAADPAGQERYKSDCLAAAGVRRVILNPRTLPSRDAVRALVCATGGAR